MILVDLQTRPVPRFPSAILSTGLAILTARSGVAGQILVAVTGDPCELKMFAYLQHPAGR